MSAEKATWKLFELAFKVQARLERKLRMVRLRSASFEVLRALAASPTGTLSINEIKSQLTATRADTVRLMDRLEMFGHIKRARDEEGDRRKVLVTITDAGRFCHAEANNLLREVYDPIADEFAYDSLKEIVNEMEVTA
jgi:DNA-binding MarR family transcriptional regulator